MTLDIEVCNLQVKLLTLASSVLVTEHEKDGKKISQKRNADGTFYTEGGTVKSAVAFLQSSYSKLVTENVSKLLEKDNPGIAKAIANADVNLIAKAPGKNILEKSGNFIQEKLAEAKKAVEEHQKEVAIGAAIAASVPIAIAVSSMIGGAGLTSCVAAMASFFKKPATEAVAELVKQSAKSIGGAVYNILKSKSMSKALTASALTLATTYFFGFVESLIPEDIKYKKSKDFVRFEKNKQVDEVLTRMNLSYDKIESRYSEIHKVTSEERSEIINSLIDAHRDLSSKLFILDFASKLDGDKKQEQLLQIVALTDQANILVAKIDEEKRKREEWGYDLKRRMDEASQIAKKEGADSPKLLWRLNVVKAEVDYGKQIDSIDSEEDYNDFMNSLRKRMPSESSSYVSAIPGFFYLFTQSKALSSPPEVRRNISEANKIAKEFNSLSKVQISPVLTVAESNPSFYDPYVKTMAAEGNSYGLLNIGDISSSRELTRNTVGSFDKDKIIINNIEKDGSKMVMPDYGASKSPLTVSDNFRSILFHESGHCLEEELGISPLSGAFRDDRAAETPAKYIDHSLQTGSKYYQNFAFDHFVHPYMGAKVEGNDGSEVLSISLEHLSTYESFKKVRDLDRETLLYGLSALDMEPDKDSDYAIEKQQAHATDKHLVSKNA